MSHIPGPWHSIGHAILGHRTKAVITMGRERVLMTCGPDGLLVPLEGTDTERLILAAPDLNEALWYLLHLVDAIASRPDLDSELKLVIQNSTIVEDARKLAQAPGDVE